MIEVRMDEGVLQGDRRALLCVLAARHRSGQGWQLEQLARVLAREDANRSGR
jgi:hypothetical protein